jgi:hypothetical protein
MRLHALGGVERALGKVRFAVRAFRLRRGRLRRQSELALLPRKLVERGPGAVQVQPARQACTAIVAVQAPAIEVSRHGARAGPATGPSARRPNRGRRWCEQGRPEAHRNEEAEMPSTAGTMVRGSRLRLVVAGAVVLAACTVSTAMAAAAPVGTPAELTRVGTSTGAAAEPRTPTPGFVLDRGRYRAFDVPQARFSTLPYGINNRGQIVGRYDDGSEQPFLRDRRDRFTTLRVPGARSAWASGINDRGQVVGYASDDAGRSFRGFLLGRGGFQTFAAPGSTFTLPAGINDHGQVEGFTTDAAGRTVRGFLLARGVGSAFTPIQFPGAPNTFATGLNDRGQLVGAYERPNAAPSPPTTAPPMGRMA